MRIPYGFNLTSIGTLEIKENEAEIVRLIFDYYLAGASLGKVVDMLYKKQILSPTGRQNGLVRRLTMFSLIPSTFPLSASSLSQMCNLKNPPAVMSTMTRQARPADQPAMFHLPCSKYNCRCFLSEARLHHFVQLLSCFSSLP